MRHFSQAERTIINALNAHIANNEEVSLSELSVECHVAKSTVVKTLQRMGFKGYQEFSNSFRLSRDVQRGNLLPREVVEGSGTQVAREVAEVLDGCEGTKSIVFSDGKRLASLLAHYFSRKLALFDIFALSVSKDTGPNGAGQPSIWACELGICEGMRARTQSRAGRR